MKIVLKSIFIWLALSFLMAIFLIVGMTLGLIIFPSEMMNEAAESGGSPFMLMLTSVMNAGAVLYFIKYSTLRGWKLVGVLFILGFGLMYFMSQMETLWFNDSVKFPLMGILGVVTGGAIMFLLFSVAATWLTGRFKLIEQSEIPPNKMEFSILWKKVLMISIVIWPLLYFSAGYFIAWQFEAIRFYYTGSIEKESYSFMFADYISSNLYFFQIFRGLLWVLLSMLVLKYMQGTSVRKGIALVLLLVFLSCSQLLLPNPFMPEAVRIGHFIETSIENALLAIIIVWVLEGSFFVRSNSQVALSN